VPRPLQIPHLIVFDLIDGLKNPYAGQCARPTANKDRRPCWTTATRGNKYKLEATNKYKLLNHTFHYNFRKFSFAARIVNIWNRPSLPDYVVDVNSVAVFKKRLDKFWADQNVMFDWTADITGTGDRSEYIVESD